MASMCNSAAQKALFSLIVCSFVFMVFGDEVVYQLRGRSCPYFGETRFSSAAEGLVNCSWYGHDACCKRTEVTSVFSKMDPLYLASSNCKNHMNYLMCYFCSPEQHTWIRDKVKVCSEFCETVFYHCMDASYNGSTIGDNYEDGQSFCEAQNFEVVDSKSNCFKFDPSVFAGADQVSPFCITVALLFVSAILYSFPRDIRSQR